PGTRILVNDGTGVFTRKSGALPAVTPSGATQYQGDALAVGDVRRNGVQDIVITRGAPIVDPQSATNFLVTASLLQNDGTGTFSDVSATKLPAKSDPEYLQGDRVYLADADGDGAPELFLESINRIVSPVNQS